MDQALPGARPAWRHLDGVGRRSDDLVVAKHDKEAAVAGHFRGQGKLVRAIVPVSDLCPRYAFGTFKVAREGVTSAESLVLVVIVGQDLKLQGRSGGRDDDALLSFGLAAAAAPTKGNLCELWISGALEPLILHPLPSVLGSAGEDAHTVALPRILPPLASVHIAVGVPALAFPLPLVILPIPTEDSAVREDALALSVAPAGLPGSLVVRSVLAVSAALTLPRPLLEPTLVPLLAEGPLSVAFHSVSGPRPVVDDAIGVLAPASAMLAVILPLAKVPLHSLVDKTAKTVPLVLSPAAVVLEGLVLGHELSLHALAPRILALKEGTVAKGVPPTPIHHVVHPLSFVRLSR
mmetsp:Transcript_702/g.1872  ORF Transcript_702/g.1872 Transcript_702/m.1872 type:complete len:349 (-) Transcript_702:76-1122(-)